MLITFVISLFPTIEKCDRNVCLSACLCTKTTTGALNVDVGTKRRICRRWRKQGQTVRSPNVRLHRQDSVNVLDTEVANTRQWG